MSPPIVGKEVGHPIILRTRVKTKVESFLSQVPVSSLAQGSLGSFDFIPQSPLGPSRHTRSKKKTYGESVEREREKGKTSFLLFSFILQ